MAPTAVEMLTGRLVGLVKVPVEELHHRNEARVCRVRADLADTVPTLGVPATAAGGMGAAFGREQARRAAIGEALERYGAMHVDPRRMCQASVIELRARDERFLDPHELAHFLDWQYGSEGFRLARPPEVNEPLPWLPGIDLATGEVVHVPVARVANWRGGGPAWYPASTNGAAVAADPFSASLSGLLELLERDAFMLMWYHRLPFPHVELDRHTRLEFAERLGDSGLELELIDLTEVHDVPVIVAVVYGQQVYGIGAAAGRQPLAAARKAFCEASAVHAASRDAEARPLEAADVRTFDDHTTYYLDPGRHGDLQFLTDRRPRRPLGTGDLAGLDAKAALRRLARRLRDRGIETIAVDLTPIEVEPLDLHAYAVVSPQLLALDCAHLERQLGNPRLRSEPTRRGWRDDQPALADLNHAPHPFP